MSSGKRYSKQEKEEIMLFRQTHTYRETVEKYSVSQMSLARWSRKYKKNASTGDRYTGDLAYQPYLHVLKYLEGVKAVSFFSVMTDGTPVASITDSSVSEDALYLAMMTLLSAAATSADTIDLGTPKTLISKNSDGLLLIRGVSPTLLVIMIYDENVDIQKIVNLDIPFIERVGNDVAHLFGK